MWGTAIIPRCGEDVLSAWLLGGTLTVDGAKGASGSLPTEDELRALTALVEEKQDLEIESYESVEGGVCYHIVFKPAGALYVCRQVGVYGHLDGGPRTLLLLYQDDETDASGGIRGITVPSQADMPDFRYTLSALAAMKNDGTLTVNVTPASFTTPERVEGMLDRRAAELEKQLEASITASVTGMAQTLTEALSSQKTELEQRITGTSETLTEALAAQKKELETKLETDLAAYLPRENIASGTEDLTAGESPLADGHIYLVYEAGE